MSNQIKKQILCKDYEIEVRESKINSLTNKEQA
jgi:hypothetical protein